MTREPTQKDSLRLLQVESIGRLLAGFSHDMKNHLGIIRESNGLVGDVLEFGELSGEEKTIERLKNAVGSVERRIEMAADMLHHLSGFAHRSDVPCSSFGLNDLLLETFTFLKRFSRLKQVEFVFTPGDNIPALYNSPSLLQHLMYRVYMFCLEKLERGDVIELQTSREDGKVFIYFLVRNASLIAAECKEQLNFLSTTFEKLGFSITCDEFNEIGTRISIETSSIKE